MLDAGSSSAHARAMLEGLREEEVASPALVVLTHSHWDHVFGADELGVPVVAHVRAAEYLAEAAKLDWSDEALDRRLAAGDVTQFHVDNVKQELPSPRLVRIVSPDIVFHESLTFDLGDVVVRVRHLPNDHTDDGCVIFVEPDRVLFVGDATCDSPTGAFTTALAVPLFETLRGFAPELVVEGHAGSVMSQSEFEELADKIRLVGALVERFGSREAAILGELGEAADTDMADLVHAFVAGERGATIEA